MTTTNHETTAADRVIIEEIVTYIDEYLRRSRDAGKDSFDLTDLRAAVGYAHSMRKAAGAADEIHVGLVKESQAPFQDNPEMIAESRRLAALGKYRPMREFLDERRSHGKR